MENKLTHLGHTSGYPQQYDPSVLEAIPRSENRVKYGITNDNPGFLAFDIWHAWEAGFLTQNGLPVAGVLKIIFSGNGPFIIESKSLKLYLSSFNMTRLGNHPEEGISLFLQTIQNDLDRVLETQPTVAFFSAPEYNENDFSSWSLLESQFDLSATMFDEFNENPTLLKQGEGGLSRFRLGSHLLRSNCKVTFQPDWGSVYIHFQGKQGPSPEGLLKYLVSFRNENHFHEEVCEMIYKQLWDSFTPEELMVTCIYTRRGGIDICPVRASHARLLPSILLDPRTLGNKIFRQ
ncbi:MAG: NADPH-dependent 7-cyano-7-deazaguanine reductase QueF [Bacteroidia bacterium]|nr:NADPH-dependent 7-cyano-7-deazaguanine reductase QueF [Bacteroidia bacterium]